MKINKNFFSRNAKIVAMELLGKVLIRKKGNRILRSKIVETEAYFGKEDPASRARQNGDLRKTMEMGSGTILIYGVHNNWMLNFVTRSEGKAEAVLIRALEPLNFKLNCSGPGLLTRALILNKNFHKKDILNLENFWIDDNRESFDVVESFRIGVKKDLPTKLRFYIKENNYVSKK